jgi:hypothetical protein
MNIILPYIADRYLDQQETDDMTITICLLMILYAVICLHLPMTVQLMIDEDTKWCCCKWF